MTRYVLSLLCAGVAASAWAADAPPLAPAPCGPTVCVPEPTTRKIDKVIYDQKCVEYCLPHCSFWSLFGGGCGCASGCGTPHVRHVLIKKIVHEDCPDVKCEVREAPCVPGP
ncbi:MAG TPA: hypothetical protein VMS17_10635 [Gemmataceae bacterium]|nr:hypothetical protein [Gemmataceae bacterium]